MPKRVLRNRATVGYRRGCPVMDFCMAFRANSHEISRKLVEHAQIISVMNLCRWPLFVPLTGSISAMDSCCATFTPKCSGQIPLISRSPIERFFVRHGSFPKKFAGATVENTNPAGGYVNLIGRSREFPAFSNFAANRLKSFDR